MVCRSEIVESQWWRNDSGFPDRILLSQDHCSSAKLLVAKFCSPVKWDQTRESSSLAGASSLARILPVSWEMQGELVAERVRALSP